MDSNCDFIDNSYCVFDFRLNRIGIVVVSVFRCLDSFIIVLVIDVLPSRIVRFEKGR